MDERLLLEEFARRQAARSATAQIEQAILAELFKEQRAFFEDPSRSKSVLGSRRAGKTDMWMRIATVIALRHPRSLTRIWSVARLRAKELLWENFKYLHGRHGLKVKTHDTELSIRFSNGAEIRLVGADKDKEIQKKRGDKTIFEIVLEAQNFGPLLKPLVEDVIEPSLLDLQGTVCLEGTPGPLCVGFWFEVTGGEEAAKRWNSVSAPGWSVHRWTMLDNPFIPHARSYLEDLKRRKNWADDNPTYLREWCGRWVNDLTALFYKFDTVRNTYSPGVIQPWGKGWSHTLGWDLGSRDDMALVIWGWHDEVPGLWEVFSWKEPGALAQRVMDTIAEQETIKQLRLIEEVADTQGGGKMYVEEVMSRFTRKFKAAKKADKYDHVRLFNDDLLTSKIRLQLGSPLQIEMAGLMRDPDWPDPEKPEAPPTEYPGSPNHCCDAGLYAYRAAWHYIKPVTEQRVDKNTDTYMRQLEQKLASRTRRGSWIEQLEQGAQHGYGTD